MEASVEGAVVRYVIQLRDTLTVTIDNPDAGGDVTTVDRHVDAWVDLTTIDVPARTKRRTVLQQGLAKAGLVLEHGADPVKVRVLDPENAHEHEVEPEPPAPPRLRIS